MATSPSTFPFFTAPHTFPYPIPTQIDTNWHPHAFPSLIPYPYPPELRPPLPTHPTPIHYLHHHHSPPTTDHLPAQADPCHPSFPRSPFPQSTTSDTPTTVPTPACSPIQAAPQTDAVLPTSTTQERPPPQSHHKPNLRPPWSTSEGLADLAPRLQLHDREIDARQWHARDTTDAFARPPLDYLLDDVCDPTPEVLDEHTGHGILSMSKAGPDHSVVTHQATVGSTRTVSTTSSLCSFVPSMFCAAASSSVSYLKSPFGESFASPTPECASVSATSASIVPPATAYFAPKVFGELPTPSSWHGTQATSPNYCYGHQTSVQSSCMQDGSTNLSCNYQSFTPPRNDQISVKQTHSVPEAWSICDMLAQIQAKLRTMSENLSQDLKRMKRPERKQPAASKPNPSTHEVINMSDVYDEEDNVEETKGNSSENEIPLPTPPMSTDQVPHSYGFDNLKRHTIFLADGTEHSYFALPENYLVERAIPEPVFDVCDDEMDGSSHEVIDVFAGIPEQQTCEEEQQASDHLLKCVSNAAEFKQTSACLTSTSDVQVFSFELQQQHDEMAYNCSDVKASDSVMTRSNHNSIEHSIRELRLLWDPGASHAHVLPGDRSIKLTNEKSTQPLSIQFVQEPTLNYADERSQLNIKKQDLLINKHNITSSCDMNHDKEVPIVLHYQLPLSSTPCIWDPGIDLFSYKKMHLVSWIPHSAILLLKLLHNKNNSSMCEFSLEKGRQVQWDPGIKFLLIELWWLSKATEYALRHLLDMQFGTHNSTYFIDTAAIVRCPCAKLIQQRNIAALFQFWQYKFLNSAICIWDPGIGISSSRNHWLQSLTAANARPLSSLQTPEQTCRSQVTSASYVWDPGTVLLGYQSRWCLLFPADKVMVGLIPEQVSFWCNAMHYCKIFQRCTAVSSLLHCHGIPLWLINFQVP